MDPREIATTVMRKQNVTPFELSKATGIGVQQAHYVLAYTAEAFGPGGKGFEWFAKKVAKAIERKDLPDDEFSKKWYPESIHPVVAALNEEEYHYPVVLTEEDFENLSHEEKLGWEGYKYRMTYATWTPEDVELGDTDDKGWENEGSEPYDYLEELLRDIDSTATWQEWSSSHVDPTHDWLTGVGSENYSTGARTQYDLWIERVDHTPLNKAEFDFINSKLRIIGKPQFMGDRRQGQLF
jgi:hypothetical protein